MKRFWLLTAAWVVFSAGLDVALAHYAHPEFWWHTFPAFDLVYGFVGCALLILSSKWLGNRFLTRDEDYYDRES